MHYVYVLVSDKDNKLYIGCTNNLDRRIKQHKEGKVQSTKFRLPVDLLYYEEIYEKKEAFKRERFLKSGCGREFIKTLPEWRNWQTLRT